MCFFFLLARRYWKIGGKRSSRVLARALSGGRRDNEFGKRNIFIRERKKKHDLKLKRGGEKKRRLEKNNDTHALFTRYYYIHTFCAARVRIISYPCHCALNITTRARAYICPQGRVYIMFPKRTRPVAVAAAAGEWCRRRLTCARARTEWAEERKKIFGREKKINNTPRCWSACYDDDCFSTEFCFVCLRVSAAGRHTVSQTH